MIPVTDREVQFPNRYKMSPVDGYSNVFDMEAVEGEVTAEGTSIDKDLFDSIGSDISQEVSDRQSADNNLQSQIDTINSQADVVDIVATYADLLAYNTIHLTENDVIKVLSDETQNYARTYYRWVNSAWVYIGTEGAVYTKSETDALLELKADVTDLDLKQDVLTFDTTPTGGSSNPVTSDGIHSAIEAKQDVLTFDTTPTEGSTNPVTSEGIKAAIASGGLTVDSAMSETSVNPVQNKIITAYVAPKSHASEDTTYGVGTTTNYGHNRVINDLAHSAFANGESLSAYQGKVLNDKINTNNAALAEDIATNASNISAFPTLEHTWSAEQTFSEVPYLSGGGIKFPSTQITSSDVNTLDDYEEGTFTPVVLIGAVSTGISYSYAYGNYHKIGNKVHIWIKILLSSIGSLTGNVSISGLPFECGSENALYNVLFNLVGTTITNQLLCTFSATESAVYLRYVNSSGTIINLLGTNITNTPLISIQGSYLV